MPSPSPNDGPRDRQQAPKRLPRGPLKLQEGPIESPRMPNLREASQDTPTRLLKEASSLRLGAAAGLSKGHSTYACEGSSGVLIGRLRGTPRPSRAPLAPSWPLLGALLKPFWAAQGRYLVPLGHLRLSDGRQCEDTNITVKTEGNSIMFAFRVPLRSHLRAAWAGFWSTWPLGSRFGLSWAVLDAFPLSLGALDSAGGRLGPLHRWATRFRFLLSASAQARAPR